DPLDYAADDLALGGLAADRLSAGLDCDDAGHADDPGLGVDREVHKLRALAVARVGSERRVPAVGAPPYAVTPDPGAGLRPPHVRLLGAGDLAVLDVELARVPIGLFGQHVEELLFRVIRGRGHRRRGARGGDRAAGAGADGERRVADPDVDDGKRHSDA